MYFVGYMILVFNIVPILSLPTEDMKHLFRCIFVHYMHDVLASLKQDTQISVSVYIREILYACVLVHLHVPVCVQGNKRAEECDMIRFVSLNIPTLVIGIEY